MSSSNSNAPSSTIGTSAAASQSVTANQLAALCDQFDKLLPSSLPPGSYRGAFFGGWVSQEASLLVAHITDTPDSSSQVESGDTVEMVWNANASKFEVMLYKAGQSNWILKYGGINNGEYPGLFRATTAIYEALFTIFNNRSANAEALDGFRGLNVSNARNVTTVTFVAG